MKNRYYLSVLLSAVMLLSVPFASARTISGSVKGAGKPLGGVLVTDGYSFVQTDPAGAYTIDLNAQAEFVYIVTPKGYVADYTSGVPQFYQRLDDKKQVYHFALQQMSGDPDRCAVGRYRIGRHLMGCV